MENWVIIVIAVAALILLWLTFYFIPLGLWFTAHVAGVRIDLIQLVLMQWRKVPPTVIVHSMIMGTKAGLELNVDELESLHLAGGDVDSVIKKLVKAKISGEPADFKEMAALELQKKTKQQTINN